MNTKKPAPLPVGNLPLGDYLRWLASTFGGEPSVKAELLQRADDADDLLAACEAAIKYNLTAAYGQTMTIAEVNKILEAAIAKAKGGA